MNIQIIPEIFEMEQPISQNKMGNAMILLPTDWKAVIMNTNLIVSYMSDYGSIFAQSKGGC